MLIYDKSYTIIKIGFMKLWRVSKPHRLAVRNYPAMNAPHQIICTVTNSLRWEGGINYRICSKDIQYDHN